MKYYETRFEEYIQTISKKNLHPELEKIEQNGEKMGIDNNLIFYGPAGTGKYTQVLNYIKNFSPSKLKYERKMNIKCKQLIRVPEVNACHTAMVETLSNQGER